MRLPFRLSRVRLLLFGAVLPIQMISAFSSIGLSMQRDQLPIRFF